MRIELPSAQSDRAPLLTSALVFVVALGLGLVIARGTVGARPPVSEDEGWPAEDSEADSEAEDSEAEAEAEAEEAEAEAEAEEAEAEAEEADSDSGAGSGTGTGTGSEAGVGVGEGATAAATAPVTTPASAARGTLVRGRVAYLRCEGGRSGGECNRDRAIEDAIWGHIESLPTCASAPVPGGQADLVVTLADDGASLRARDTFADDVTRLDAIATVGCLESAIAAEPVLTGSARRIILSFRFSLAP